MIEIDDKKYEGFVWYNPEKKITIEQELEEEGIENDDTSHMKEKLSMDKVTGVFDMRFRDFTENFCRVVSRGDIKQFEAKKPLIRRRLKRIIDAVVYRFKDEFSSLLVENNRTDWGYRPMPRNNMWIEVGLEFGDVIISGIHLEKVFLDDEGNYQEYVDGIIPPNFNREGISIFVTGISDRTTFYSYFTMDKISRFEEKKEKGVKYVCPYCSSPLNRLDDHYAYYCDESQCVEQYQKGNKVLYDMSNKKIRNIFRVMKMNEIWSVEDNIRNFVSNFLDFLVTPDVVVERVMSNKRLEKKNKKRVSKGKDPFSETNIIKLKGELKRYLSSLKNSVDSDYTRAKNETWVSGHYMRFWDKSHYTRLYSWISKCNTEEQIQDRLKQLVRKDDKGNPLPDSLQYQWDYVNKVIKVWKRPFIKNEGVGNKKDRINVVEAD